MGKQVANWKSNAFFFVGTHVPVGICIVDVDIVGRLFGVIPPSFLNRNEGL